MAGSALKTFDSALPIWGRDFSSGKGYAATAQTSTVEYILRWLAMTSAATLLHKLPEYIHEQAKEIDPRCFRLSASKSLLWRREDLIGLPGLEFDLKVDGDHIWLCLHRPEAVPSPAVPIPYRDVIRASTDPMEPKLALDKKSLRHRLCQMSVDQTLEERATYESIERDNIAKALERYCTLWESWAEGERQWLLALSPAFDELAKFGCH